MDLFGRDAAVNLLPHDGEAIYFGEILDEAEEQRFFEALLESIAWKHDEAVIFGKRIVTAREVAWYGDEEYSYTYSGTTKTAARWTSELAELKALVEDVSGDTYNSCLLNLYHDGSEGMAWHSDDEKELSQDSSIASLSLGVARKFSFRHKASRETLSVMLERGSLLVMKGSTQRDWQHCVPKTKKVQTPRINLTFRSMAT